MFRHSAKALLPISAFLLLGGVGCKSLGHVRYSSSCPSTSNYVAAGFVGGFFLLAVLIDALDGDVCMSDEEPEPYDDRWLADARSGWSPSTTHASDPWGTTVSYRFPDPTFLQREVEESAVSDSFGR